MHQCNRPLTLMLLRLPPPLSFAAATILTIFDQVVRPSRLVLGKKFFQIWFIYTHEGCVLVLHFFSFTKCHFETSCCPSSWPHPHHPHGLTPISPVTLSLLHLLLFIHYLSPLPLSQNQIFTSCSDIHKDRKRTRPPEPSHLV